MRRPRKRFTSWALSLNNTACVQRQPPRISKKTSSAAFEPPRPSGFSRFGFLSVVVVCNHRVRYFATRICARAPNARSPYLSVLIRILRRFSVCGRRVRQRTPVVLIVLIACHAIAPPARRRVLLVLLSLVFLSVVRVRASVPPTLAAEKVSLQTPVCGNA